MCLQFFGWGVSVEATLLRKALIVLMQISLWFTPITAMQGRGVFGLSCEISETYPN